MISSIMIPFMVLGIVFYGVIKKVDVYDSFIEGCKESFEMAFKIFPNLVAMFLGINMLINSNILDIIKNILSPLLTLVEVPFEIVPMALLRPISGTSSLAILNNIMKTLGVDSLASTIGSVIQGSTDTTFYVLTLYFGSVGIKKIRYSLYAGLFADLMGIISAIVIVKLIL